MTPEAECWASYAPIPIPRGYGVKSAGHHLTRPADSYRNIVNPPFVRLQSWLFLPGATAEPGKVFQAATGRNGAAKLHTSSVAASRAQIHRVRGAPARRMASDRLPAQLSMPVRW